MSDVKQGYAKPTLQFANFIIEATKLPVEILLLLRLQAKDDHEFYSMVITEAFRFYLRVVVGLDISIESKVQPYFPQHYDKFMTWAVVQTYVAPYVEKPEPAPEGQKVVIIGL